ncbi:hypothetical protein F5050DRAFT_609703 [Lentinula boryana]|uniref:Uncharacterized protein n=1 Tax=Lentinula boryana TaxID=40481 RepID=A0ABQ8Q5Z6_9AGAR|nr:hypothetical protein F5050DRAFT_609703 [Lentinula boryana]
MAISFIPAIDEVVRIALPEWHTTGSTVELRFSAVLGDEEFQQFKEHGMKVQVWSDIYLGGKNEGEWGEIDLHEVPSVLGSSNDSQAKISLGLDDRDKPENLLSVICSVPFARSSHYSFTYRVVYSSGEIKWLGQFGRNGTVHIDATSKNTSGIVFEEGLVEKTAPFVWSTRGKEVEDLLIAEVVHPEDWSIWAVGKNSLVKGPAASASLVFLVPRFRSYARYCPKTIILTASPAISISVSAFGRVQVTGSGSLLLRTFDPDQGSMDSFFDRIFAHTGTLDCRLLGVFGDVVALASTSATPSGHAILVPLNSSGFVSQIVIPSASLASILSAEMADYTIFSEARPSVQFVSSVTLESGSVQFSVPPSGGHFILTPLYSIPATSKNEGSGPESGDSLSLSVLSPHLVAGDTSVEDAILPTPPPSPHLHPIAHLTSSYNHSTTSISELGEQDAVLGSLSSDVIRKDTLVSESSSLHALRPPVDQITRQSSPSLLLESYRETRENILVAFMKNLYFVLMLWSSMLLRTLYGGSTSVAAEYGVEENPVEQSSAQSPLSVSDPADSRGSSPVIPNERTPLLSRVIPPSPVIANVEPAIRAPVPSAPYVMASIPSQTSSPASLQFELLEVKSGPRGLVFRDTSGLLTEENLSDNLVIEFNGQSIPLNKVQRLDKGVVYLYLETDWEKPGRLNVKLTSSRLL